MRAIGEPRRREILRLVWDRERPVGEIAALGGQLLREPDEILGRRTGDIILRWGVRLHFGRWRSHTLKVVWVIMGLIPAVMFVTGGIMWWNRVVRRPRTAKVRQRQPVLTSLQQEPQGVD